MITKQEIISVASALNLLPTTVEKDYILSWVLFGISQHPDLSKWLFKGGTCLKKCYFETYRFSEDLDFTVPQSSIYDKNKIKIALKEIADNVYQNTGINLNTQEIEVRASINKNNHETFIAKFTYLGPLNLPSRTQQRVSFDITDDEVIFDLPEIREVFHFYSDRPNSPAMMRCYSINEILAEKTRAIYERQGRARDIYDIVNISRNFREHVDAKKARIGLIEKFRFKSLVTPSVNTILSRVDFAQLKANWHDQLRHQLQVLPSVESFYNDLQPALSWWIDEHSSESSLVPISNVKGETTLERVNFFEAPIQIRRIGKGKQVDSGLSHFIEVIRYAARSRLCVEIVYHGITRLVEPYSLRQPSTGNILLYNFELERGSVRSGRIKAFKLAEITSAKIIEKEFTPRYIVEL